MRKFLALIFLYFFIVAPSYALFVPKDCKKTFIQRALTAEKRQDNQAAFFIYEKAMFYYYDDKSVLESYAAFCERGRYYAKAASLYQNLYELVPDEYYLFKKYLNQIKQNNLSAQSLKNIQQDKRLSHSHQKFLNNQIIILLSQKKDWGNLKVFCDKIPLRDLDMRTIGACIIATETTKSGKASIEYYLRYHELFPYDVACVKKILSFAEKNHNYKMQEEFLRKFSALNPNDKGIKYRLAGFYEKNKQWQKAIEVYDELITKGDKSQHVLSSYAFSKNQLENHTIPASKKLPSKNKKQHAKKQNSKMQTFASSGTITDLLKKQKKNPLSFEEQKTLAFLYSKSDNLAKSLEIIEQLLQKTPDNEELLRLALQYSMAQNNWDKAIFYNEKLLTFNSCDEILLKNRGDFYSIEKNFTKAVTAYENLTKLYPKFEYQITLTNLYMATQDFCSAQKLIQPLYIQNQEDMMVAQTYLSVLLAQNKLPEAAYIVQKHNLQNTKEGATILGDLALMCEDYGTAKCFYDKALGFDNANHQLKNKLAYSYRKMKKLDDSGRAYCDILQNDPENIEALMGLGYLEIDKKNYRKARGIFSCILSKNPYCNPARIGIANTYLANGDNLQALCVLKQIKDDKEAQIIKAQTYYDMGMLSDAKKTINGLVNKDAEELNKKIQKDSVIAVSPHYSFLKQTLAEAYKLNYNKVGVLASQSIKNNLNVFTEYNLYTYQSGRLDPDRYTNLTNEIFGGVKGRVNEKNEFQSSIGAKFFQFDRGTMLITDSWLKRYLNDKNNITLGFKRNNVEQSYLSAVGTNIDGVFTGQVADSKVYLEYNHKLPKQSYWFGRYGYGVMTGLNIQTNQYMEGLFGIGRLVYDNPDAKRINTVNIDFVSYNAGYQYNLLDLYSSLGILYGGYFSPKYFSANTFNVKAERNPQKGPLKYGIKTYVGPQFVTTPNATTCIWGVSPYLSYELNDRVSANLSYNYYHYANISRNLFLLSLVFRGGKKYVKS
jgi:tetratricopeptide (TPR) repeat protein